MKTNLKNKLSRNFLMLEKRLPLEKFIPSAFLIFLLCVLILSLITYRYIERYKTDIEWINHTNDVIKKVESIHLKILEVPLLRRGYVITGDKDYLYNFNLKQQNIKDEINKLKALTLDNPIEQKLIISLDSLLNENTILLDSSLKNYINSPELKNTQIELTQKVQHNLEEINKITEQIKNNETQLLNERNTKADSTNLSIQLFIIITSILSFIVIGLSLLISDKLIRNKNKAEQLLINSYEELEDKVGDRTIELKKSNEKLSEEISVRKKTEETLRESEQRFKMMADSAAVLIWISGKDKLCYYFNKAWLEFTGRTLEQELGNGWREGIHKDDLEKCLETYISAFDNREPYEMEYRLRNANGNYRWILGKGIPRYEGDEFVGYIGSCIDINQRKKNERFLKIQYEVSKTLTEARTIEEASKKILKNICSGINWNFGILWTVDKNSDFLKKEALWSDDENDAKEYSKIFDKSLHSKNMGIPGLVLNEGKFQWITNISEDKNFSMNDAAIEMGWNSELGIPISNGTDTIAIIECFNKKNIQEKPDLIEVLESAGRQIGNFIERKKTEEKLNNSYAELEEKVRKRTSELAAALSKLIKESEEKEEIQNKIKLFAHAIKSTKDCVYITDLNNNTIFVNEAFEFTYGFLLKEIAGKEIPVLKDNNITPILKTDIINETLNNGWKGELVTSRKDGSRFYTFLSTSSIKNDEGKIEALVGICQDITELKNSEDIINKRNNLLNLLNDVIRFTNKTFDLDRAIQYSLTKVCQYTQWEIGHCFLKKGDDLFSSKIWNNDLSERYFSFKQISETIKFEKGKGIPGGIFDTGKSLWLNINELKDNKFFKRTLITKDIGLKVGIWIPIILNNETIGVLEFLKKDEELLDEEVMECINNIGIELGSLYEKLETIEKIRKSEKLLNDAQHIAKLGSWEWDVLKNTISWSDEMYAIFELTKEEFDPTFEGYLSSLHPDDKNRVQSIIQNAFINKNKFNFFHRIITPSGKIKIIKSQGEIYLNEEGEVIRMFGTGHDVTDIKEAEEKLKNSENQLKVAQKIAKVGSWELDNKTGKIAWSDEVYNIFEISHDVRTPIKMFIESISPNDIGKVKKARDVLLKDKLPVNIYYKINTTRGNSKIVNVQASVFSNPEDNTEKVVGTIMDITEIKKAEEELRRINDKLIKTQNELIHNEKLAALGRFSSGIAHEIRNPLANIYSLAQMVVKADIDEKNKKRLNFILTNVEIANKIIKSLLSFASPEDLVFNHNNLKEILNNIIESVEARCDERNIKIITDIPEDLPLLYIDKLKLENAFMNFVSNSIDAMQTGGELIINIKEDKSQNEIIINFIDTGIGIPQENIDKILEPFFTTKDDGIGLGMGLAHQTIKLHQGFFNIKSKHEKGTHIEIKLPIRNINNN